MELHKQIENEIKGLTGREAKCATKREFWEAISSVVIAHIAKQWQETTDLYNKGRKQHYFSAEYLVGRGMLNNLINLGIYEDIKKGVETFGVDLADVLEEETDPALGNGGLGRLAACFLDSSTVLDYPVLGYGILYRYGLFKQLMSDGFQEERPDTWMVERYPFIIPRPSEMVDIVFSDMHVKAIPCDMPITGYGTDNVNTLRLWKAEPYEPFDLDVFNEQHFVRAAEESTRIADIWRVLYPNDTTEEGKILRLRQQYFFTSASLQDIIRKHIAQHGNDFSNFAKYNCIQLNDTHPVVAIPELARLLMDVHGLGWDETWKIIQQTFAYTNHTIMQEALEKWDVGLFERILPRVYEITKYYDIFLRKELSQNGVDSSIIDAIGPISDGKIHMARLASCVCFSINGVAALHTEILKKDTLKSFNAMWPNKINNKTNGVTPRKWLKICNPELSDLITKKLGSEAWVRDLSLLKNLEPFKDDEATLYEFLDIKSKKKEQLINYFKKEYGIEIAHDAVFDVQIKRIHEYKRQLLNILYILDLYDRMKQDPQLRKRQRVFIFGGKAAPGYYRAKSIIKLVNEVSRIISEDNQISPFIKVFFVPNYRVSLAEKIIPATDISEQISKAGMEASGTGNMKFMMNGALTLGTLDGANVEIVQEVGEENAYIFGATSDELAHMDGQYNPQHFYETVPHLKCTLDQLHNGYLQDSGTNRFMDLFNSLLYQAGSPADFYYVLGDFEAYRTTRDQIFVDYENRLDWARKCWINISRSGIFSSDRTINNYVEDIWKIDAVHLR